LQPRHASIVIPSFNYARFLRNAIDSALKQQPRPLEVVVVDDGSADESPRVIASYGSAIKAILKENGGHASALNAGCRAARGEVVFLLDSDDEMRPGTLGKVLAAWRPETVLFHWRPRQMDAQGRDIPGTVPAPWVRLDEGDVRQRILATGGFETTVTSGLALRRDALERVLPIPEDVFRQGADGYLVRTIAFLGEVQAIDEPLTRYRRHGENDSDLGASRVRVAASLRRRIEFKTNELGLVPRLARQYQMDFHPRFRDRDPEYLFLRLASMKLEPANHPMPGDRPGRLLRLLLGAHLRSGRPTGARLSACAYAAAIGLLPRALSFKLLSWRHTPHARPGWLAAIAAWRHRVRAEAR
jgi:glycosyltransferase involved in cell wall biosynthesis